MRSYLPSRGELALDMMHATASLQVSFDWSDEADMIAAMRASLAVTPIVTACFANSSLHLGRPSGFVSRRAFIWRHTDPDRSGLLPFVFEPGFGYDALRGVGPRRADVLPRPRRSLSRDERQDLPSVLAGRSRRGARHARRLGSPPHDAVPGSAHEAGPRSSLRRRGARSAARLGAGALEGDPLRPGRARMPRLRSRRWTPSERDAGTPRCGAPRPRRRDAERPDARAGARTGRHRPAGPASPGSGRGRCRGPARSARRDPRAGKEPRGDRARALAGRVGRRRRIA